MKIYIHIPFCSQKCTYCKFALTPIFSDYKKKKYLQFLQKEIKNSPFLQKTKNIDTIYFGGGTPSILSPEELKNIISLFPEGKKEITLEANPEDICDNYLMQIFSMGINRLSLGIQSLNNTTLEKIGRKNNATIFSALESIKKSLVGKVGSFIPSKISINIDLILGLPYTKKGEILNNLKFLHENYNFITHSSVYILEKGLYPKDWKNICPSDEEIINEYNEISDYFQTKKWHHYEVSNWSKPGFESTHNMGYWNHNNSLGFGLSASSFFEGKRWENSHSFLGYYQGKKNNEENLTPEQIEIEKLLFGLRTNKGYQVNKKIPIIQESKVQKFLEEKIFSGNIFHFYCDEKFFTKIDAIINDIII